MSKYIIVSSYRPPTSPTNTPEIHNDPEKKIEDLEKLKLPRIILTDSNIDLLKVDTDPNPVWLVNGMADTHM